MEELDHYYGYVVYQHTFKSYTDDLRMRIIDGRDRAKIYLDDQEIATQYQEEIGDEINLPTHSNDTHDLKILMEIWVGSIMVLSYKLRRNKKESVMG